MSEAKEMSSEQGQSNGTTNHAMESTIVGQTFSPPSAARGDKSSAVSPVGTESDIIDAILECEVCEETYEVEGVRAPFILSRCGHSFCFSCLSKLPRSSGQLCCPHCRRSTPLPEENVSHLPKNFAFIEQLKRLDERKLQSVSTKKKETVLCSACDQLAQVYCTECRAAMCTPHYQRHNELPFLSKHKVLHPSQKDHGMCQEHERPQELYCLTDHHLVCHSCPYGAHRGHDVRLVSDVAKQQRKEIKAHADVALAVFASTHNASQAIAQIEMDVQEAGLQAVQRVRSRMQLLHQLLQSREEQLIKEIQDEAATRTQKLQQQRAVLVVAADELKASTDRCVHVMLSNDVSMLYEKRSIIHAMQSTSDRCSALSQQPCTSATIPVYLPDDVIDTCIIHYGCVGSTDVSLSIEGTVLTWNVPALAFSKSEEKSSFAHSISNSISSSGVAGGAGVEAGLSSPSLLPSMMSSAELDNIAPDDKDDLSEVRSIDTNISVHKLNEFQLAAIYLEQASHADHVTSIEFQSDHKVVYRGIVNKFDAAEALSNACSNGINAMAFRVRSWLGTTWGPWSNQICATTKPIEPREVTTAVVVRDSGCHLNYTASCVLKDGDTFWGSQLTRELKALNKLNYNNGCALCWMVFDLSEHRSVNKITVQHTFAGELQAAKTLRLSSSPSVDGPWTQQLEFTTSLETDEEQHFTEFCATARYWRLEFLDNHGDLDDDKCKFVVKRVKLWAI